MKGLRWTTAGESHGRALLGVLEGMPAGLALDVARIDAELARRQRGYGRGGRMKIEEDRIELLSGTRAGLTLGSPIAFTIVNQDATIERLPVPTNPRPGHADLAGCQKLTLRDPRAVLERASARETAARVALGAIARALLDAFGVEIFAPVLELGGLRARTDAWEAAGEKRRLNPTMTIRDDPSAELSTVRSCSSSRARGFSTNTCFSARSALTVRDACRSWRVATHTTPIAGSRNTSSKSVPDS